MRLIGFFLCGLPSALFEDSFLLSAVKPIEGKVLAKEVQTEICGKIK